MIYAFQCLNDIIIKYLNILHIVSPKWVKYKKKQLGEVVRAGLL